ncbi:hypothetical protein [Cerasicoccus arenae]|uniref:Uncharacterized protein n=1 Tax=Cerasicoccus arenae TaxID=424488 RepID=A0A8J3DGU8_9BACT|nr:hypothetical protein [Cerasicoccus arenae]MBK1858704.1 hypothetical protein [Cerasicoccus arenae]GHB98410.1 hypothetical protein GCM10007047_13150 [Cerasicoccus arenae]
MQKVAGIVLVVFALLLGGGGWLAPVYLDAVAPAVLRLAGAKGKPAVNVAEQLLDEGQFGPAWRINTALASLDTASSETLSPENFLNGQIEQFIADHPKDRLTGNAEPFGLQFIQIATKLPELATENGPLAFQQLLTPRANREALRAMLIESRNQNVQHILATKGLTGVRHFMPVASAAGAPLDSAILTTALLVQAGLVGPEFARELATMAQLAMSGEPASVARLEAFYLSMLGAAQRLDWASLGAWTRMARDPVSFMRATTLLRQSGDREALVFSLVMLSQRPDWVADYYETFGDEAWPDFARVFPWGGEALRYLLERQLPLYQGPALWSDAETPTDNELTRLTLQLCAFYRPIAMVAKVLLLLTAGMLLAAGIKLVISSRSTKGSYPGLAWMQNGVVGVILLLIVVSFQEPQLFAQPVTEPGTLFLEFELPAALGTVEGETMPNASIDQQTVLVLLIFLMVQFVIYIVCLMKISQLKRAPVPAETRITLLENEEPLFDLGLYVGLSGTVISLLMLAMGIVQASLVAAYASTLFGIIFVALLKILHVRPLKRKLILER